jgi:LuxR family transcriptional regulator, maltose regulon positive regulatory protein
MSVFVAEHNADPPVSDGSAANAGRHETDPLAPGLSRQLFDAKFSIPPPRPATVSRAALIETARSSGCRYVSVKAPAGYGKSTFLAEWAAAEERPVAWVSLDRFDNDPAVLLTSLAAAYGQAGLASRDLLDDVGSPGVSVLGRAAPRLAAEFRASPAPFVLMLDDLHELQSSVVHDVLGMVISAMPQGSQLAAASRSEQPHLPRLRAAGDALELGVSDLAIDAAGARQLFAHAQVSVTPEVAAAVTERTEGWPAGLYLAALIERQDHGRAKTIAGDDRYVADYLYRETLARQPKAIQRFLRRTAMLDQLCGPLCEAVLASSAAPTQLRRIEDHGLFLIPLDRQRQWYRYHGLFREFLLGELRRTEPDLVATLHQRAADWYEANGAPALAVEHLLPTADRDRAAHLVTRLTRQTYRAGQLSTLRRWYRAIGDETIERHPPLAVHACLASVITGDIPGATRWAAAVEAASFDLVPGDGTTSFDSSRALLRAFMCAGGPEQMMSDAAFAVNNEAAWSPYLDTALWLLAEAHLLAGRQAEARSLFAEAAATAMGNSETIGICEAQLAWLAMDRGEWAEAADHLEVALNTIEQRRMHDSIFSVPAFTGAARLFVHRSDLTEAHRQLTMAMRAHSPATYLLPYHAVRSRLQLARVHLAIADQGTVHQLMREIESILAQRPALGALADEVHGFRCALASSTASIPPGTPPLTPAELRLLPYLPTHLTANGIAQRLFVSSHTVKTEIRAIYRKLGVSSRNDAVQRATAIGLLGALALIFHRG